MQRYKKYLFKKQFWLIKGLVGYIIYISRFQISRFQNYYKSKYT